MTENEFFESLETEIRNLQASAVAEKVIELLVFTGEAPEVITDEVRDGFATLMDEAIAAVITLSEYNIDRETAAISVGSMGVVMLELLSNLPYYVSKFPTL